VGKHASAWRLVSFDCLSASVPSPVTFGDLIDCQATSL
jgi:hypothetical protein